MRTYKLNYKDYRGSDSARQDATGRSLLLNVIQYDKNASVDTNTGEILNESNISKITQFSAQDYSDADANVFNKVTNLGDLNSKGWLDYDFQGYSGLRRVTAMHITGDFNGDGKTDILKLELSVLGVGGLNQLFISNGDGTFTVKTPSTDESINLSVDWVGKGAFVLAGDFNADGKTDLLLWRPDGANRILLSNGDGSFVSKQNLPQTVSWTAGSTTILVGDFDGDGKSDVIKWDTGGAIQSFLSRNNYSQTAAGVSVPWSTGNTNFIVGDFTGSGRPGILKVENGGSNTLLLADSNGSFSQVTAPAGIGNTGNWTQNRAKVLIGDFNGDGKTDILKIDRRGDNVFYSSSTLYLSIGNGTFASLSPNCGNNTGFYESWQNGNSNIPGMQGGPIGTTNIAGDFNGDGKTDVLELYYGQNAPDKIFLSNGDGTFTTKQLTGINFDAYNSACLPGDFFGTGKTGFLVWASNGSGNSLYQWGKDQPTYQPTDTLMSFQNAIGGSTAISYTLSTKYLNTQLIFPVKTVSSVTTNDGNGNVSPTTYSYSGGYYHIGDRDFRGFNYVKAIGPAGSAGEQRNTETYFHQGNDLASDANTPGDTPGYMKGKPYRTKISAQNQASLSESTMQYAADADGQAPYYNPLYEVDTVADGMITWTRYVYDNLYGNLLRLVEYGDIFDSMDNRTTIVNYSPNAVNWIVGLPSTVSIYNGAYLTNDETSIINSKVKSTAYYYDGTANCDAPSTSQNPDKGNLTRQVYWSNNGTSPELRMAYDNYGNLSCRRDATGNTTNLSYDGSNTFPKIVRNPLGQQTTTQYYGVDGIPADKGLYGQTKSVTDPNGAIATTQYDSFGRKTLETLPDGFQNGWSFNDTGTVGTQYVYTGNSAGIWKYSYFDGLGRAFKETKKGPDSKTIRTDTVYDKRGAVSQKSLPYFDGVESVRWTRLGYDARGRVKQVTNPDGTKTNSCYGIIDHWGRVGIDENSHRKRNSHDAFGRLIKAEEYLGTYSSCTTDVGTPYATTSYQYDGLGNLTLVTDTNGITTEMRYDSLGRKYYMKDPDMGVWGYVYDGNGNLTLQTDAKGQQIKFAYDALDRLKTKDYGADNVIDVTYNYDETSMTNPIGRLTTMSDGSGAATYSYDNVGRIARTVKTVGGISYPINYAYSLGRLGSITYPDNETVAYGYDGAGNLSSAGAYATFSGFNALGQPGNVTYGNGVGTAYQYKPSNNRLSSIITTSPVQGQLINLSYGYDNRGNITSIDGLNDSDIPNYPSSNGYNLYPGKAHAIGSTTSGRSFQYDDNGNMTSDGQRTFTYTLENMPKTITASSGNASFVYDGNASRVKKISPYGTTLYIDKLYECTNGVCGKYIFAGNSRVALKTAAKTLYYHGDHLGSTVAVTNATGALKQNIAYYPYGETRSQSGTEAVSHRYTGQEYDDETGLYNYNARLYSPEFERFVSPDSVVPDYTNPQSLNRYAYALNNPLRYTDPTGHDPLITFDTDGNFNIGASGSPFIPTLNLSYGGNDNNSGYNLPNYNANLAGIEGVDPANWNTEPLLGSPFDYIGFGLPKLGLGLIGSLGEGILGILGRDAAEGAAIKGGNKALTSLWRAVNPEELIDIQSGIFRNLGSAEGKYFSTTAEGAASYAKQAVFGFGDQPYTLIKTEIQGSLFRQLTVQSVDRGIPAVVVPNSLLPGLTPRILNYFPLPIK